MSQAAAAVAATRVLVANDDVMRIKKICVRNLFSRINILSDVYVDKFVASGPSPTAPHRRTSLPHFTILTK